MMYSVVFLPSTFFADPSHVIGLYPNLLPQEYRNQLSYPEKPPDLEGGELEKALLALQDYLTQVRQSRMGQIVHHCQSIEAYISLPI